MSLSPHLSLPVCPPSLSPTWERTPLFLRLSVLQSHAGALRFFPVWDALSFGAASFKTLRAYGGLSGAFSFFVA